MSHPQQNPGSSRPPAASSGRRRGTPRRDPGRTPMMSQYQALKREAGDAILFYRMGDFYEMFFEDAQVAARICDLTLTSRNKSDPDPIPMAGVPWHSADAHVQRLLRAGRRVAICEQVERPGGRGLMEREIVEVLTPGTALAEHLLEDGRNNYLVALWPGTHRCGLAAADISTGEFSLAELPDEELLPELERLAPRELIYPRTAADHPVVVAYGRGHQVFLAPLDEWLFAENRARKVLLDQWQVLTLEPYGVEHAPLGVAAAGALVAYARDQRRSPLAHLRPPRPLEQSQALLLDDATLRNLEVLEPLGGGQHSLLAVLDRTLTPMGARLLRRTLARPLLEVEAIRQRHRAVGALVEDRASLARMREHLGHVGDIERLVGRLHAGRARARDLTRLRDSLAPVPELITLAAGVHRRTPFPGGEGLEDAGALRAHLTQALVEDPVRAPAGEVIRDGYDAHLDEQRELARGGARFLAELQRRERESTGIPSLKVGHNKVFGYYIEVTKAHLARVPEGYERKQTLVNAERFVTPELKTWEEKILGAQEAARLRQDELVEGLKREALSATAVLQEIARTTARWDLLAGFAQRAIEGRYTCPEVDGGDEIRIVGGRHPVVERFLQGETFVPNDAVLDARDRQIAIITGPNMAGKSTFLRQVGLLVLMAQTGSFVPAEEARIGVADRLFTRVGASDRIAAGQSTFLVEMIETSRILHQATSRSLVLLDEVGRGTSTFDGLAIAWAVAEHLRDRPMRRPRTLFATHFHELTELARRRQGYCNLNVQVKEWKDQIIFVRRVVPGAADRSYGIHVAQLAGLPMPVLERAREILTLLEEHGPRDLILPEGPAGERMQITLFGRGPAGETHRRLAGRVADALDQPARAENEDEDEAQVNPQKVAGEEIESEELQRMRALVAELEALDPNQLSPREALDWIYRWKRR